MHSLPDFKLVIHDITAGNTGRLEAMLELFVAHYPRYAYYAPRIREVADLPANSDPDFIHHQWLAEIDGDPAGVTIFKYALNRNCGLGLDLVVHPNYRKKRFGKYGRLSELLTYFVMEQLKIDASQAGKPVPHGLLVEVEQPRLIAHYQKIGLVSLPVDYLEPPYILKGTAEKDPPKDDFHRMSLCIYPIDTDFDPSNKFELTELVQAFHIDHYGLPEDHWALRQALISIQDN